MWVGSWAADFPSFTLLSVSLDACERAQMMCLSGRSPRFTISVRIPSSAVGNQVLATYIRSHTNVLLQGRTPLFLSRLLTRVPIQSFERRVGGRALGGSRNFEVSPIQSNYPHASESEWNQRWLCTFVTAIRLGSVQVTWIYNSPSPVG
jgi:hypothetical protein